MRYSLLITVLALAACREQGLSNSAGRVHLEPHSLDFGTVFIGQSPEAELTVRNDGRSPLPLEWRELQEPFFAEGLPTVAPSGETKFLVHFKPLEVAPYRDSLAVSVEGVWSQTELLGTAAPMPPCPQPVSCHVATFDVALGACVETAMADGTSCDAHSACVTDSVCQAGRCVGTALSCDDQNACTVDVCNAVNGCEHLPAPPCPGDGTCQVGTCDPHSGCGFKAADDGTACGPVQSCDQAQVCISGECVLRDPPDGFVCAQASPCQSEGRCVDSVCQRGPATTLTESWSFDSASTANADLDQPAQQLHDFVLEPSGAMSLFGFFQTAPQLRVNTDHPSQGEGPARRCMLWNNRLICADYPAAVNGKVSALDLATGATLWTFDLRTARPDFMALASTLFLGRLAVQGSDRLAALFEAYPKTPNPNATTNCRSYFLVVLDASGGMVSAQPLTDPVLDVCNHPHPYGFGADSVGNLFVSFSPTIGMPAPLVPGSPTTVMSFTRDGVFRWKFTDQALRGGELAVATGLLYPENSGIAVMAATGVPAFALAEPFGRLVVTRQRSVPAPNVGDRALKGYEAGTESVRWVHALKSDESFWSDQIRLASWQTRTGERTVALTFVRQDRAPGTLPSMLLRAIDTRDGSEAFTCPVAMGYRTEPQLMEVADGTLGLMEGSDACGKCDPPFAGSSAAFHTFRLPLISAAREPWLGTFGGPGHDHREEVLFSPTPLGL